MFKKYAKITLSFLGVILISIVFTPFKWLGILIGATKDAFLSGYESGADSILEILNKLEEFGNG